MGRNHLYPVYGIHPQVAVVWSIRYRRFHLCGTVCFSVFTVCRLQWLFVFAYHTHTFAYVYCVISFRSFVLWCQFFCSWDTVNFVALGNVTNVVSLVFVGLSYLLFFFFYSTCIRDAHTHTPNLCSLRPRHRNLLFRLRRLSLLPLAGNTLTFPYFVEKVGPSLTICGLPVPPSPSP